MRQTFGVQYGRDQLPSRVVEDPDVTDFSNVITNILVWVRISDHLLQQRLPDSTRSDGCFRCRRSVRQPPCCAEVFIYLI